MILASQRMSSSFRAIFEDVRTDLAAPETSLETHATPL